jgi:hypothetical protein
MTMPAIPPEESVVVVVSFAPPPPMALFVILGAMDGVSVEDGEAVDTVGLVEMSGGMTAPLEGAKLTKGEVDMGASETAGESVLSR